MLFNRNAEVIVGGNRFVLDEIDIDFTVEFDETQEFIVQDIYIYNLSEDSRNGIEKGDNVILNAGYDEDTGSIVIGNVYDIEISRIGTDIETKLLVISDVDRWLTLPVSRVYAPGTSASFIVRDLLEIFGLEVQQVDLVEDVVYQNGLVIDGVLREQIRKIVSDCGSVMNVNNNQIFVREPYTGVQTGFVLSGETGMISSPARMKVEDQDGYKVRMLLNHRINVNTAIQIQSNIVSGDFLVVKGVHRGDFTTEVEVIPL